MLNSDSDKTDGETLPSVESLGRYLATKYETNYLMAAKQAWMLTPSIMNAATTTSAMIGEANLCKNWLQTIHRYLNQSCGSQLIVPEQWLDELSPGVDQMVPPKHDTYLYWKTVQSDDAKPESVNYWMCTIPNLISREVPLMLELLIMDSKVMRQFLVKDGVWW
jgi:hypothetical protein